MPCRPPHGCRRRSERMDGGQKDFEGASTSSRPRLGSWNLTTHRPMATTRGSERLRLQQWLQERHITLHPDLEIEEGRIVAKESIEPKTTGEPPPLQAVKSSLPKRTVASIPKRVVLSERTTSCDVARISAFPIPSPVRLAVCLLHELSLGSRSPWADYLASLPTETVPIAAVWPADSESRRWILGTEAARLMEETYTDHVSRL